MLNPVAEGHPANVGARGVAEGAMGDSVEGARDGEGVGMPVGAYVLIQTEVGKAAEVARQVGQIAGVLAAEDVTGPYDVIARAESRSVDQLGRLVVSEIQRIEGITRTITCPIVKL